MAIQPPRLDDRAFDDLRAELIRRIPVHAPEWTDHNASDPGIALIELFAALGDNLLYRLNRVPEAARLEFLRLLAIAPKPARVAGAMVRLEARRGPFVPIPVDFGTGSTTLELAAGDVPFQALEEVTALPVELGAWVKQPYTGPVLPGGVDNGGVHLNSGLLNLVHVLLSDGGKHPRSKTTVQVPKIGIEKALKNNWVFAPAVGFAFNSDEADRSSLFVDAELNRRFASRAYVGVLKSYRTNIGPIPEDLGCADAFAATKPFAKKKNGKEVNPAELSEREKLEAELVAIVSKLNDFELSALVVAASDMAKPTTAVEPEPVAAPDEQPAQLEAVAA